MVYRRALEVGGIDVVAVNGSADAETLVHLLKYDSVHGIWKESVEVTERGFIAGGQETACFSTRKPEELPWEALGVDVVIEATGAFRTREGASRHLRQGASRVVITAPAKTAEDADVTLVMGVNQHAYQPKHHAIVSAASCTTNCLAPVAKVLHESFGIESAMMTTIHSYTNDQKNLDNPHKDLRRARACASSVIPTSTGVRKAIGLVLPELQGKLEGLSVRVPTPNVSLVDLVARLERKATIDGIHEAFRTAAGSHMQGILGLTEDPLVSVDFNGDSRSAVVDGLSTLMLPDNTVKVLAWYDNEWAYSCRVVDVVRWMALAEHATFDNRSMAEHFPLLTYAP